MRDAGLGRSGGKARSLEGLLSINCPTELVRLKGLGLLYSVSFSHWL